MMARINLTSLLATLLLIHTAVAVPFGGWFKRGNGTYPAFPTYPTSFPTATGFPFPTATGGYWRKRDEAAVAAPAAAAPIEKREAVAEPQPEVEVEVEAQQNKRFVGPLKNKRFGFGHYWVPYGGYYPSAPTVGPTPTGFPTASGIPYPTGTGFPAPTGTGFPAPTGTGFPFYPW